MTESILAVAALVAIAVCAALFSRLRRGRKTLASIKAANADLGARARFIADYARQPIVMFDARGLIRRANPAAEKLFGYGEPELYGQSILRLMPESPAGRAGETELRCKDGSRVRRRFSAARTAYSDQSDIYLFFDEEAPVPPPAPEAPVMQPALENVVNRIVGQFEDLLTTINGYTELALHGTPPTSPIRKDLEEIAAASDALSNLARNLLAYSGRQTIPVEPVDLNILVGSLEAGLREAMKAPIDVELATERTTVLGNGECLGQILLILCTSARHRIHGAAQNTGRVEIRTERRRLTEAQPVYTGKVPAGVYSVLTVSDSGPAIEPATMAQLFEPLFLDRETVGVELGPVHGIVRNLGGWINVISEENAGTTFEVLFPYAGDFRVGRSRAASSLVEGSVVRRNTVL
jgi:nitrogen fixation/metabolism regulation signal transduction histidine kinase